MERDKKTIVDRQAGRWQIYTEENYPNSKINIITVELQTRTQR